MIEEIQDKDAYHPVIQQASGSGWRRSFGVG
jgi:hypothetical protein